MRAPTTVLLVRHGMTDYVGRALAGRSTDVHLNPEGRQQAERLAARLAHYPLSALYSSPLERALETAAPLAAARSLDVRLCEGAMELDFGEWTGRTMAELEADPLWTRFNTERTATRAPGGELMSEAQSRMIGAVEALRGRHAGAAIALVSHADVIRAALAHYAGISLDVMSRFDIRPASVSAVRLWDDWAVILCVNETGDVPI
jgi:probable phosphomutase (TIGR03848 family)